MAVHKPFPQSLPRPTFEYAMLFSDFPCPLHVPWCLWFPVFQLTGFSRGILDDFPGPTLLPWVPLVIFISPY